MKRIKQCWNNNEENEMREFRKKTAIRTIVEMKEIMLE